MKQYILISPVRNEVRNIESTLQSVVRQTRKPLLWVIADDGSTDGTSELVNRFSDIYSWIHLVQLPDRGYYDLMEAGELKAFLQGLATIKDLEYDYIGKLDGDISFDEHYYELLLQRFEKNPKLGIASGNCWHEQDGRQVIEPVFPQHVRGAMRVYRKTCWDEMGGLVRSLGWDAIDCYKARMLGWETRSFEDLLVRHHVKTWAKGGLLHGRRRSGRMEYLIGTHPLFFTAKCLRETLTMPFLISAGALAFGYLASWLKREKRVGDRKLVAFVRKEQISRMFWRFRNRPLTSVAAAVSDCSSSSSKGGAQ